MKREVFIIHSSCIVRKGLCSILKGSFDLDMTELEGFSGLLAFSELTDARILVISHVASADEMQVISRLKRRNTVHHICIVQNESHGPVVAGADHTLTLETGVNEWKELVARLFEPGERVDEKGTDNSELTVRERDVLLHVALGHSNKEIADKLFISIHTVISHRKNITEKLGIKSISGLTVYAILNRIIDPELINPDQLI